MPSTFLCKTASQVVVHLGSLGHICQLCASLSASLLTIYKHIRLLQKLQRIFYGPFFHSLRGHPTRDLLLSFFKCVLSPFEMSDRTNIVTPSSPALATSRGKLFPVSPGVFSAWAGPREELQSIFRSFKLTLVSLRSSFFLRT